MKIIRRALESVAVAFAMYSALPMPQVEWNGMNMRFTMCLLPLVGVVIGVLLCGLRALSDLMPLGAFLRAALATALPILVTGGIHLDGFCDTADAIASHASSEKKLLILKDPHLGAFGAMRCMLLLILTFALWYRLSWSWPEIAVLALGFILSRLLSGLSVVCFPCAKSSGLLHTFRHAAARCATRRTLLLLLLLTAAALVAVSPFFSAAILAAAAVTFLGYRMLAEKHFGGVTGDVAGYFLQSCEWAMLAACVLAEMLSAVL